MRGKMFVAAFLTINFYVKEKIVAHSHFVIYTTRKWDYQGFQKKTVGRVGDANYLYIFSIQYENCAYTLNFRNNLSTTFSYLQ